MTIESEFESEIPETEIATRETECTEWEPETGTERLSLQKTTEDCQETLVNPSNSVNSTSSAHSGRSVYSTHSVNSARSVYSVPCAINNTMPTRSDEWKTCLFKFIRALKFDCNLGGADMPMIRPHVEQWHGQAKLVIDDIQFADVWGEVVTSWERAKYPAFADLLTEALETAKQKGPAPTVPKHVGYDEPDVELAYRLLFWLTFYEKDFFISCRALGARLGIDHKKAWRILRMFEADGVIVCRKRGRRPKASRYEWVGKVMPSKSA